MHYNSLDQCINNSFLNKNKQHLFCRNIVKGVLDRPSKCRGVDNIAPILFSRLKTCNKGKPKPKSVRILLDCRGSASIINKEHTTKLKKSRCAKAN